MLSFSSLLYLNTILVTSQEFISWIHTWSWSSSFHQTHKRTIVFFVHVGLYGTLVSSTLHKGSGPDELTAKDCHHFSFFVFVVVFHCAPFPSLLNTSASPALLLDDGGNLLKIHCPRPIHSVIDIHRPWAI